MKKSKTGALRAGTACPIVLLNGDKGGPGKSFTTRVVTWQMLASGASIHAFDGDPRNGHVDRHYGKIIPVDRCNLRNEEGWSLIFDKLDSIPDDQFVVIDLPGGAGEHLHEELARLRLNEEFGRPLIHVWVADHGEDGVRLFKDLYAVGAPDRTVFVMNLKEQRDTSRFRIWLNSDMRAQFLIDGGTEVTMPHLRARLHDRIAETHAPFGEPLPEGCMRSDLLTFRVFAAEVSRQLQPLLNLVLGGR